MRGLVCRRVLRQVGEHAQRRQGTRIRGTAAVAAGPDVYQAWMSSMFGMTGAPTLCASSTMEKKDSPHLDINSMSATIARFIGSAMGSQEREMTKLL